MSFTHSAQTEFFTKSNERQRAFRWPGLKTAQGGSIEYRQTANLLPKKAMEAIFDKPNTGFELVLYHGRVGGETHKTAQA